MRHHPRLDDVVRAEEDAVGPRRGAGGDRPWFLTVQVRVACAGLPSKRLVGPEIEETTRSAVSWAVTVTVTWAVALPP